jgi:hypothetical protein
MPKKMGYNKDNNPAAKKPAPNKGEKSSKSVVPGVAPPGWRVSKS